MNAIAGWTLAEGRGWITGCQCNCDVSDFTQQDACRTLTAAYFTFRWMKGTLTVMDLLTLFTLFTAKPKHFSVRTPVGYRFLIGLWVLSRSYWSLVSRKMSQTSGKWGGQYRVLELPLFSCTSKWTKAWPQKVRYQPSDSMMIQCIFPLWKSRVKKDAAVNHHRKKKLLGLPNLRPILVWFWSEALQTNVNSE